MKTANYTYAFMDMYAHTLSTTMKNTAFYYFSTLYPLDQILDSGTTKQKLLRKTFSVTNVAAEPSSHELSLILHLSIYCVYLLLRLIEQIK